MKLSRLIISLLFAVSFTLFGQTFIAKGDSRNQATFNSNAPLEDIEGISNVLEATANLNPNDLSSVAGTVKVDMREMKTGIGLRDRHLQSEMWLDSENYPYAEFMLNKITGATALTENDPTEVKFHGTFSVHGVSHEITADGKLTYIKESEKTKASIKGNLLKVHTSFVVKLGDYNISIPDMVAGKVDENIKVSAIFIATDSPGD